MHNHITNHLLYFRNGQRCVLDKLLWHGYMARTQNFTLVTTRQNTDWLFPSTGNHGPYHHHYYYDYHYYDYHCHYNYHQAEYRLTISTHWEPSAFPRHFPQWRPAPQWSKTIGDIFLLKIQIQRQRQSQRRSVIFFLLKIHCSGITTKLDWEKILCVPETNLSEMICLSLTAPTVVR